ncbi:ABC transporter ATP-binding protein [Fundicoccus culcitae]|uniref:Sn-glycerol-3-phosphate ABC transporter ATP-binding protein UgpC n=1 Tax=Fundicoccus culcitae TaxID=2969821 RepID=A0ABY5P505_9LACT|nr:sn-glycerol-3-phosphate ABC transporter ATP-binding protein UgpC [Fundicoccus culcitae]UUX33777.1 sn-glycerol-3-phosphate ABC transporter ATP-binding protein UgpC [Fundicoccus culcitae]
MEKIKLNNLRKTYQDEEVIHGVDLTVNKGEFIVFVGPSGCGKSTLLNMIAGLETITGGELFIDGKLMNQIEPKDRNIAMVFQNYALYPHLTVFKNLSFGLEIKGVKKEIIKEKVHSAAKIVNLENFLDRYPKSLSGGQQQRVALGRALVRDVDIFLMDEPLSNLDAKLRTELRSEIKSLHKQLNNTIIYVTHDQVEALTMADRIVVLNNGEVMQVGTPEEVYNNPQNLFVAEFIGTPRVNTFKAKISNHSILLHKQPITIDAKILDSIDFDNDTEIVLAIRPEHVLLTASESNNFHIIVEDSELLGSEKVIHSKIEQDSLSILIDPLNPVPYELDISFPVEKLMVFNSQSGIRI